MDFGDFTFPFTPFLFRSRKYICSRQGSGPWERTNISCLLKLSWQTLRAYQAFAPRSISFFARIACGAHGLVSISEFMCFYVRFHGIFISISFIVDKISIVPRFREFHRNMSQRRAYMLNMFLDLVLLKGFFVYTNRLLFIVCCFLIP